MTNHTGYEKRLKALTEFCESQGWEVRTWTGSQREPGIGLSIREIPGVRGVGVVFELTERQSLTRQDLDRLKVQSQTETMLLGCHVHPAAGNTAIYDEGHLRLLCRDCGFEAARIKVALSGGDHHAEEGESNG